MQVINYIKQLVEISLDEIEYYQALLPNKEYLPLLLKQATKFETLFNQILAGVLRLLLQSEQNRKGLNEE